jgi:hypothetical protein
MPSFEIIGDDYEPYYDPEMQLHGAQKKVKLN